ncbi:hypothetical protein [Chitinophaga eiseniae]|uniref:Uncharacterized protein n=1 Tax=Chitinophaga eiseniae TaxID=634771 RepID=A0A847SWL5_9BACT|nr:hypothetical protein [Chitinophaga eiseniae]NLR81502.1 hypothetical protein [Chitinophaga eiseniae]
MKLSPKLYKWLKILLVLFLLRVVIGGILYYLVTHKFVNVIQYIVNKESGNTYKFDAEDIDFSLLKRNIVVHNAKLICRDTLHVNAHYNASIPRLYLSIQSWRALIFHKKLLVDSLSVISPHLTMHEHMPRGPRQDTFQLSSIVQHLEQTLEYVNARIVHVQEGSLVYSRVNGPAPLHINHFNFSIVNFTKVTNSDNHILGSDDVEFSFDNQYWILPDGRNTVSFKRLHFSGKKQVFELDSCTIVSNPTATSGGMSLQADKFYFNARHLPAIYMRQELLIDTLVCIRPVLKLPGLKTSNHDKKRALDSLPNTLFKKINFRYIAVKDGALLLTGHVSTGTTRSTNLNIYNLTIAHDTVPGITTDSIALSLNKIKFYSLDSLFQLSVDEFILQHNDVIFNNVEYGPTPQNHSGKGLTFTAPSLRLNDVSLEDLLKKHLKADNALLFQPRISFLTKEKRGSKRIAVANGGSIKMPAFYQTLHNLSEVIMVDTFHIQDGNASFTATGQLPVKLQLKNITTDVLLHNFFLSDSLVDIKHSMPNLHIREISAIAGKTNIAVNNYTFDGTHRHNKASQLVATLENGACLTARELYWEVFDWDVFQQSKDIQVGLIRLGTLQIQLPPKTSHAAVSHKNLPVIRIGQLDIRQLQFRNSHSSFDASNIAFRNLRTLQRFITWGSAAGQFHHISHHDGATALDIAQVSINRSQATVTDASAILYNDNGYTKIKIPSLDIAADIHSTELKELSINSLSVHQPEVSIYRQGKAVKKNNGSIPLMTEIKQLDVQDARIAYMTVKDKDSSQLQTHVNIRGSRVQLHSGNRNRWHYDHMDMDFSRLQFHNKNMDARIPQLSAQLHQGSIHENATHQLSVTSGVDMRWQDVSLALHHADTLALQLDHLSGIFNDPAFVFRQPDKIPWASLLHNTRIDQGALYYKNKQLHARVDSFAMDPDHHGLTLYRFQVMPNLSAEETFRIAKWQRDYITVAGEALHLGGLQLREQAGDTTLIIRHILADHAQLTTQRDKRIPFEHGIEKYMPTQLINTIPFRLQVDSIELRESAVTVKESSKATQQWSAVPITGINALITHFGNVHTGGDSLHIIARGQLLGSPIHHFSYQESYSDSLSGFVAQSYLAPMDLERFNAVAIPMAAVKVKRGYADSIYSRWTGNKYATLGDMHFFYHGLQIQVLNKKDTTRAGFMDNLKTTLANLLLRNANHRPTRMFFIRDREKFVFNYWVKAETSGIVTAVGVKKDRKYLKRYNKVAKKFSLPKTFTR